MLDASSSTDGWIDGRPSALELSEATVDGDADVVVGSPDTDGDPLASNNKLGLIEGIHEDAESSLLLGSSEGIVVGENEIVGWADPDGEPLLPFGNELGSALDGTMDEVTVDGDVEVVGSVDAEGGPVDNEDSTRVGLGLNDGFVDRLGLELGAEDVTPVGADEVDGAEDIVGASVGIDPSGNSSQTIWMPLSKVAPQMENNAGVPGTPACNSRCRCRRPSPTGLDETNTSVQGLFSIKL